MKSKLVNRIVLVDATVAQKLNQSASGGVLFGSFCTSKKNNKN
jgi:hypothetical protein